MSVTIPHRSCRADFKRGCGGRRRPNVRKTKPVTQSPGSHYLFKSKAVRLEAWSEGERRAYAAAWLGEIAPSEYTVTPFQLREIGGADIPFELGALTTSIPLNTFDQATAVLKDWATEMMARHARLHR